MTKVNQQRTQKMIKKEGRRRKMSIKMKKIESSKSKLIIGIDKAKKSRSATEKRAKSESNRNLKDSEKSQKRKIT